MYEIHKMQKSHIPGIISIIDNTLGEKYYSKKDLYIYIDNVEKISFVCLFENKVVGVILLKVMSIEENDLTAYCQKYTKKIIEETKCALIEVVSVKTEYQNNGIASSLIKMGLKKLEEMGIKLIFAEAWRTDKGDVNIEALLLKNKFVKIVELPRYWEKESKRLGFSCASCGFPCICNCVLFVKFCR